MAYLMPFEGVVVTDILVAMAGAMRQGNLNSIFSAKRRVVVFLLDV